MSTSINPTSGSENPTMGGTSVPQPKRPSRRGTRKKKAGGTASPSSSSVSSSGSRPDSGFSEGDSVFTSYGLSISGRRETIRFVPKTEGFFKLVQASYAELCSLKPEAASILSLAEWTHVHALMLYGRMANCEFEATGFKQPAPTRIALPNNLRVFHPVFAQLSNLGIVKDAELFAEYVPHCTLPKSRILTSEDVSDILECIQYPWEESWEASLADRKLRVPDSMSATVYDVSDEALPSEESVREEKEALVDLIADLGVALKMKTILEKATQTQLESLEISSLQDSLIQLTYDADAQTFSTGRVTYKLTELTVARSEAFAAAKSLKFRKFKPSLTELRPSPITYQYEDSTVLRDPGAYGLWLGWDPKLWKDYSDFVDAVQASALFSLSFPKETSGTYAWILPRVDDQSGFFVKMPKALSTPEWMGALMLDAGTLPAKRTSTWYGESDRLQSPNTLMVRYIKAAIKNGMAVETFR